MKAKRNQPRPARSLTVTLTIAFIGLSVMALFISQTLQFAFSLRSQQAALTSQQQLIAQEASKEVAGFIQERFSVLETAVKFANPTMIPSKAHRTVLESLLGLQPAFRQLILLNTTGQQVSQISRLSSVLSPQFKTQLTKDIITQSKQGQRYIGPVYIDDLTSEPLMVIAVPAQNVFGDFQGVLVTELNLKFMWELVDQLKVGETGYAYVVDNQGNLIAFGDTARVLRGENARQIFEVKEFIENPSATGDVTPEVVTYTGLLGESVVGAYVPLGTPQWAVVVELPEQEAYHEGRTQGNWTLIISLGVTILAGLIGFYSARRLAAPLIDLSHTATEVADGNLEIQAKIAGPAEIAQVASTFNIMTSRLRDLISTLEQRVADRTKALATSAEISRRISTIMDRQQLIDEVVERVNSAFNYYHTQMYFYDPTGNELLLAGGTGEAGKTLLKQGHKLPKGKGLVGRAAETNASVIVSDVSTDLNWLPNPLLPETRSEIATPISSGDTVIGVLDVQHNKAGGITKEDADVLQSIANQIMIAAQNGRLLLEAQKRAEREALISSINQKIQTTTTVKSALQVAVREIGRAFGTQASVQLAQSSQRTENK